MPPAESEAERLWGRADLVRAPAVVTRVSETFVSVALSPPHGSHSLPWQGPRLRVGDRVTVAGETKGGRFHDFRPLVVRVDGGLLHRLRRKSGTLVTIRQPDRAPVTAATPQPWLDVLVRHGLLDAERDIPPDLYACDPVGLLVSVYAPRAAMARGLVHYDVKWGNDTEDLVADLAGIVGQASRFSLVAADREMMRFTFRHRDAETIEAVVEHDGDLDQVAARMNACLAELGELDAPRRIWTLDTGMDRWAFLGRTPEEIAAMRDEGLPIP